MNWLKFDTTPINFGFGCTSTLLQNEIFVIGGNANTTVSNNILQVKCFSVNEIRWKVVRVNTNGLINRSYHAALAADDKIYLFGGIDGSNEVLDEVLSMSFTNEGFKVDVIRGVEIYGNGLSANNAGSNSRKIVLFGGRNSGGSFSSDVTSFASSNDISSPNNVAIVGNKPSPRAYHSSAVVGERMNILVVVGGRDESTIFNDIWILDMLPILEVSASVESQVAKSGKSTKATEVPVSAGCVWTRATSTIPHRCLHRSFVKQFSGEISLFVFGGVGLHGVLPTELVCISLGSTSSRDCSISIHSVVEDAKEYRYGFGSIAIYEDDKLSTGLVFGGSVDTHNGNGMSFIPFQSNSKLGQALTALSPYITKVADESKLSYGPGVIHNICYDNGDVYEGEVEVLLAGAADAADAASTALGDEDKKLRHGVGKLIASNGDIYEGSWKSDIKYGFGIFTKANNEYLYEGLFVNDQFHGMGKLTSDFEKYTYEGQFVDGKKCGYGISKDLRNNTSYEGNFSLDSFNGHGELVDSISGKVLYSGNWIDGVPQGSGKLLLDGLHVYSGSIVNGVPQGSGTCQYSDGSEYVGDWKSGKRNGFGVLTSALLDTYKGKWVADMKSGNGVWQSRRGDAYDGVWERNLPHGKGRMTYADSVDSCKILEAACEGNWHKGKRVGLCKVTMRSGKMIDVNFDKDEVDETSTTAIISQLNLL